jgi:hypothetical protein
LKDKSCITKNVVEAPKVGMCIVYIQYAKPNVSHEKTTKQFIIKNLEISNLKKQKTKDSDKNLLSINK